MDEPTNSPLERSIEPLPITQLTTQELVTEARDLHAHFQALSELFAQAPASQREEIREEMQPLVERERQLREEYGGRVNPALTRDQAPEQAMTLSY